MPKKKQEEKLEQLEDALFAQQQDDPTAVYDERGRLQQKGWYACAVTTGREKAVRDRLTRLAQTEKYKDKIFRIVIPSYKEVNEKGKEVEKLFYTQYLYVEMILNDDTYHGIKIDGFRTILPADNPTPMSAHEVRNIFKMIGMEYDDGAVYEKGETVQIVDKELSAFYRMNAEVVEVDNQKKELSVMIEMLGKQTKMKCSFDQIEKLK